MRRRGEAAGSGTGGGPGDLLGTSLDARPDLFPDEVADGVKAGDSDAVGAVYACLADRLLGYLVVRVGDRATAEDLLEATFVELLRKGSTIRGGPAAIKVWLFKAAHYNALDHLRRVRRRGEELYGDPPWAEVEDPARGPAERAEAADVGRTVRAALERLGDDQRQVLVLRYVGGLGAREVAEILGKTDGAVRSLQHRAERALARILAADGPLASTAVERVASTHDRRAAHESAPWPDSSRRRTP